MANFKNIIPENKECFIKLRPNTKIPLQKNWLNKEQTHGSINPKNHNIGLLLGSKSGIIDVDLDCSFSKALAKIILPQPSMAYESHETQSGHYLYRARDTGPTRKFFGSNSNLVELRAEGAQTMVPPSIHPNGNELLVTQVNDIADAVKYENLLKDVSLLAASSEISQLWAEGYRHNLTLAFSGLCLKKGIKPQLIADIIYNICNMNNDLEVNDRVNIVKLSIAKPHDKLKGYSGLVECVGEVVAKRVSDRVDLYFGSDDKNKSIAKGVNGEVLSFGQFSNLNNITEAKLSEVFAQWLSRKALFVTQTKQWFIWNGSCWATDDCSKIYKMAIRFIHDVKEALFAIKETNPTNSLSSFERLNRLENLCKLASIDSAVSLNDFDEDQFLLACPNKWIDLRTANVNDPDPSLLVSKIISTNYNPESACPNFIEFLNSVFENDCDLISFVQRAVGYSLTGSTSEQCLLILIGDGANGKSTFINIINKLFGDYSKAAASQTLIAKGGSTIGDDLVDLIGARLIPVSETEEGEALAESKIKQMTGGDALKARPLYGKYIEFEIIGKIWLATNSLPNINNTDHGIWRRIQAIPFNRTFNSDEQDKDLSNKLSKELPGILNWAIQGCLEWQKQGLNPPQIILDQVKAYKTEMDSVAQFVDEECLLDVEAKHPSSKLYDTYRHFCFDMGRKPQSSSSFKRALDKLHSVYQSRTSSGMYWHGIRPQMTTIV